MKLIIRSIDIRTLKYCSQCHGIGKVIVPVPPYPHKWQDCPICKGKVLIPEFRLYKAKKL